MKVEIIDATIEFKPVIKNLYPLYLHDLSEFVSDIDVSDLGLFNAEVSNLFWQKDALFPFLVKANGKLAGFTLIASPPYTSKETDYMINEFFIIRKYRRKGIGRLAAFEVFNKFRGKWEVSELPKNLPAQLFWHKVIGEYTSGRYETLNNGTKQRFINTDLHWHILEKQ
ncbi:hypothetical protein BZZ01_03240 [Nostocales cyanobacterium HT-58-2]|nr:hypothetical protein BZZ01_03240 [Nostocales cyanobacterium HT-58-2]